MSVFTGRSFSPVRYKRSSPAILLEARISYRSETPWNTPVEKIPLIRADHRPSGTLQGAASRTPTSGNGEQDASRSSHSEPMLSRIKRASPIPRIVTRGIFDFSCRPGARRPPWTRTWTSVSGSTRRRRCRRRELTGTTPLFLPPMEDCPPSVQRDGRRAPTSTTT